MKQRIKINAENDRNENYVTIKAMDQYVESGEIMDIIFMVEEIEACIPCSN